MSKRRRAETGATEAAVEQPVQMSERVAIATNGSTPPTDQTPEALRDQVAELEGKLAAAWAELDHEHRLREMRLLADTMAGREQVAAESAETTATLRALNDAYAMRRAMQVAQDRDRLKAARRAADQFAGATIGETGHG